MNHLCWEDKDLSEMFVRVITLTIKKEEDRAALKPYFQGSDAPAVIPEIVL